MDDAKVEVDMWNEAATERVKQPFVKDIHGPLFEWLLGLILCQFKVNAFQSFVQFMGSEHGWFTDSSCTTATIPRIDEIVHDTYQLKHHHHILINTHPINSS